MNDVAVLDGWTTLLAELFDVNYYRQRYADIRSNPEVDPLRHYCTTGWKEGRDPNAWFSTRLYLIGNLDSGARGVNPLLHYALIGRTAGRRVWPPLAEAGRGSTLPSETELIRDEFDLDFYCARYSDLGGHIDPFEHYCIFGWREGRDPAPWFSTAAYLATHADVAEAGVNPFIHYVLVGRDENREVQPAYRPATAQPVPMRYLLDEASLNARGVLRVWGWVVCLMPVESISVYLNDRLLGLGEHGIRREDVALEHPDYPNADSSGFLFLQEVFEAAEGDIIRVTVTALGGVVRQMTLPLEIASSVRHSERRATAIRHHVDSLALSEDGRLAVEGWAVSSDGIEAIEVDLDGVAIGRADVGLPRADVGNAFPLIPTARTGGFRISKDLRRRFDGEHAIVLTLYNGRSRVVVPLAVAASTQRRDDGGIQFYIDSPKIIDGRASDPVFGDLPVVGWAVAPTGIDGIEVFLDGEPKGRAYFGARREDIQAAFPTMLDSVLAGFGMSIPKRWADGTHQVKLVIRERNGNERVSEFSFEARASDDATTWRLRYKVKQAEADLQAAVCAALESRPAFVLLLRLRSGTAGELRLARDTLAGMQRQTYGAWRVLVVCPADVRPVAVRDGLGDLGPAVTVLEADATPLAQVIGAAPGGVMVGLLAAGDDLAVDALQEIAIAAGLHRQTELFYCDERRVEPASKAMMAYFKPDWSPDLLLSTNYLGRLWVIRATALTGIEVRLDEVVRGGDYDLLLRLTDVDRRVHHIPKLLCAAHRPTPDTREQERQALRRALRRRAINGVVREGCLPHHYRVQRAVQTAALVSIIVPTIAAKGLIRGMITSIRERTAYRNFEIVCVDGIPETEADQKLWLRSNADKIVVAPKRFNWSRCNNLGVARADGDYFVFLNDDMEVIDPYWLHALLEHAQRPEVGVVGPLLLYPEGKVQHAGLVLMQAGGKHIFRFAEGTETGPFGLIQTQRNMIGVTGACMMMSRAAFTQVGGFDEAHTVINNDLDYCLRCWRSGLRVIYTPHTRLIHYEESSRTGLGDDFDVSRFTRTWRRLFALGDPFTNPHLAREHDGYRAESEPTEVLHVGHPIIAAGHVRRILVVKLDHIGDFITAIPAINRLKERFPAAEVTALVGKSSASLARMTAAIDRVIEFNFFHARSGKGRRTLGQRVLDTLRDQLAPYRFDIAVDLRQQIDTRGILKYTGATWLAGYDLRGAAPWLDITLELVIDNRLEPKRAHVADALLQMVEAVATACNDNRQVIPGSGQPQARDAIAELPVLTPLAERLFGAPLVCIHPGVGSAIRQWPAEHFAALGDLLVEGEGANIILVGSPDELALAAQVQARMDHKASVVSLIGKTSVEDLPNVLQASDLFIGNNSGPHHLAAGLGVPTVGVHAGVVDATEWGPLGTNAVALRRSMNCSPCYLEKVSDCHRGHACMRGLLPRDVYRVCQRLLALRYAKATGEKHALHGSI